MTGEPLRVLIVDDSRIFRAGIEEALAGRTDLRVIGSVWNGEKAIEFAKTNLPDLVTLDIEMPGMGGMATLKALLELAAGRQRQIGVILVSSHARRGAAVTIQGLQEGAFDFITKPDGANPSANAETLKNQLLEKIAAYRSRTAGQFIPRSQPPATTWIKRRTTRFQAVVIGASTGGPVALGRLLPILIPRCPVPVFLVQHLPPDFAHFFSLDLSRRCNSRVVEALEGNPVEPGVAYVAQGGKHLVLNRTNGRVTTEYSDVPPENGCRPAADVLFRSASVVYEGKVLAAVLTGMGSDGAKGSAVLKRAGAHVIVQDEATSVVWGMPGSVVAAGAADQVLPIDEIGPAILMHLGFGD